MIRITEVGISWTATELAKDDAHEQSQHGHIVTTAIAKLNNNKWIVKELLIIIMITIMKPIIAIIKMNKMIITKIIIITIIIIAIIMIIVIIKRGYNMVCSFIRYKKNGCCYFW